MNDELLIEECRKVLRRIAWRLQYQAKKISTRELPIIENICGQNQMSSVDSKLHLEEIVAQHLGIISTRRKQIQTEIFRDTSKKTRV
ncbi:hypothetical protein [Brevibacillus sp. FIR094]|uniref:hypothetical protein n=1 Tax=Brevibacillus sp. FIR094 TaxID=3134809 RepID=UPI003D262F56